MTHPHLTSLYDFLDRTTYLHGLYCGFVEWKAPPEGKGESRWWKLGFISGFLLKAGLFLYLGARYVPA